MFSVCYKTMYSWDLESPTSNSLTNSNAYGVAHLLRNADVGKGRQCVNFHANSVATGERGVLKSTNSVNKIKNMPLTIASVFNFIPINLWQPLKKFVTQDETIVFDLPFKMSVKYTPGLLIVMMCLSFANQFVRNVELSCSTNAFGGKGNSHIGYANSDTDNNELNDFCWNHETFLVAKALEPNMRGAVTYPGVSGYNRGNDELLQQRYYKYVWLMLGILTVVAFLPYFFWKARGITKIKPLVAIADSIDYSEEDQRLVYFLDTVGFNGSFAWFYVFCKILATLSPIGQWYYLCGFLGSRFKYYGYDVLSHFTDDSQPWPNPMDVLFPKMAKCEWSRYGFGGDVEVKSALCQMPMNNMTQWSFFVYWWWITVIFVVNMLSLVYLAFHLFPCCRRYKYRKFVRAACREDVEKLLNYNGANGQIKNHHKNNVISIKMGFGDWLVLSFIKKNLVEWKFRDFIRKIATTENIVIQLKPAPIPVFTFDTLDEKNLNPSDGYKTANMEIGFKKSIINQNNENQNQEIGFKNSLLENYNRNHLNDSAYDDSTECDTNESSLSSSQEPSPIKIVAPVKIDRKNLSKPKATSNSEKTIDKKKRNVDYGWKAPGGSKKQASNRDQYLDTANWD